LVADFVAVLARPLLAPFLAAGLAASFSATAAVAVRFDALAAATTLGRRPLAFRSADWTESTDSSAGGCLLETTENLSPHCTLRTCGPSVELLAGRGLTW
jgi:hypothetical protein